MARSKSNSFIIEHFALALEVEELGAESTCIF